MLAPGMRAKVARKAKPAARRKYFRNLLIFDSPFFFRLKIERTCGAISLEHGSIAARAGTFLCPYCPYKRQGPGGTINAVHRDAVRAGIRHIGELTGRMDGYRGRRYLRSYRSYGR